MDYKYIEQLLQRYWNCETSLEEESILRSFFAQKDVPVRLLPYRDLFVGQQLQAEEHLGADFDKRILALTEEKGKQEKPSGHKVAAKHITRTYRLRPFFQAAASVAVVLCLGMAVQQAALHNEGDTEVVKTTSQQLSPTPIPETAYGEMEPISVDTTMLKKGDVNL